MAQANSTFVELAMQKAECRARIQFAGDEEKVLDAISVAWELAQAGEGTPNTIAFYACKRVISNRQFPQTVKSVDTIFKRRDGNQTLRVSWDALPLSQGGNPARIVAFRIDFLEWRESLPSKVQRIVDLLASGETTQEAAKLLEMSESGISWYRRRLMASWYAWISDEQDC